MMNWIVTSSVLILVVLALRQCLKGRISLRLQYGLWALVLVRLLVPVSVGSTGLSVLNVLPDQSGPDQTITAPVADRVEGTDPVPAPAETAPQRTEDAARQGTAGVLPEAEAPVPVGKLLLAVWLVGGVGLGLWLVGINLRFAQKLRRSRCPLAVEDCPLPVYVTQAAQTPCLAGILRPAIYVTPAVAADPTVLRHSVAHEFAHFRHGDHLWSVLRGLCLALHWYNPLVWLAAVLSQRDGELCCDEATVRRLGEGERAAYGRTLLAVTCQRPANPLLAATGMTGGGIQTRIALLAERPKTAVYTLAAVLLIGAAAVGCTFTGAAETGAVTVTLAEGIEVPQVVADYALEQVQTEVTYYGEDLGYDVTEAKVTGLTPMDTGTATNNSGLALYLLEYRIWVDDPDQVQVVGGMQMEDNAITEWGSTGQPCLLFRWEDNGQETTWERICATNTLTIGEDYSDPAYLEQYGDVYTAAAMELYAKYRAQTEEEPRGAEVSGTLRTVEVALRRDGDPTAVGPGNWADLFRGSSDGTPEVQIQEGFEPIYGEGDHWDRWSVEGFSALRYYSAAEDAYSANTIDVTRKDVVTPRGIRVGDSREEVLAAYPVALTGDYWGKYPNEPDLLAFIPQSQHEPGEITDLSQLEFHEGMGPAILFFFDGDTLRQITLTDMFD